MREHFFWQLSSRKESELAKIMPGNHAFSLFGMDLNSALPAEGQPTLPHYRKACLIIFQSRCWFCCDACHQTTHGTSGFLFSELLWHHGLTFSHILSFVQQLCPSRDVASFGFGFLSLGFLRSQVPSSLPTSPSMLRRPGLHETRSYALARFPDDLWKSGLDIAW